MVGATNVSIDADKDGYEKGLGETFGMTRYGATFKDTVGVMDSQTDELIESNFLKFKE